MTTEPLDPARVRRYFDDAEQAQLLAGAAFDVYVAARDSQVANLLATIDDLRSQLPPPVANVTAFGCSRPDNSGADTVPAVRTYIGTGKRPTNWLADSGLVRAARSASKAIVVSWKEPADGWLDTLLSTRPVGLNVFGCQNHEPFDNFSTAAQIAEYHRRWDAAVPIMEDHGVIPCVILDGSHPESWDMFARDDAMLGMDRYNAGIQTPKQYVDPSEVFGPYLDWLDANDRETGLIAETGTGRVAGDSGTGQRAWIQEARDVLNGNVAVATWWNAEGCTLTAADLALWLGTS